MLFLLRQEHLEVISRWFQLLSTDTSAHWDLLYRNMLWMILTLISVGALPLRPPDLPPQPPAGLSEADQKFAEEYLQHFYGYQSESDRQKRDEESGKDLETTRLCEKMKKMQSFFGLLPSGELNAETLAVMKKPRCGLSDVEQFGDTFRWKNHIISYRITEEHLPFPAPQIHKVFRAALKLWSNVALLKFCRRKSENVDIDIAFVSVDHGDGALFDQKGGVLAHAFLPSSDIGGDVHFDADEEWSLNSTGTSLSVVAAHEFGHALGLPHSPDIGAIMFPAYYSAPNYKPQLSFSDVADIQQLYGINPRASSRLSKRPPPRTPDKCDPDLSFDAVTGLQQELVFFKDRFIWRKHKNFIETGISLISSLWPHPIPSYLDAVYENVEMNFLLFFKGPQYWKVRQSTLQEGFPRNISDLGFPSRINSVDAALHFRDEQYTVFFTGHECWRYNEKRSVMEGSPMLIEQQWPEIPAPIDAAVFYQGFVKFFKGNTYYNYNFNQKRVVSVSPANDLLECKKTSENKPAGA